MGKEPGGRGHPQSQTPGQTRQYQMFDFYVLKNWPVTKVARVLGVNIGQVYLAKHRLARLVKKEISELEKKMI